MTDSNADTTFRGRGNLLVAAALAFNTAFTLLFIGAVQESSGRGGFAFYSSCLLLAVFVVLMLVCIEALRKYMNFSVSIDGDMLVVEYPGPYWNFLLRGLGLPPQPAPVKIPLGAVRRAELKEGRTLLRRRRIFLEVECEDGRRLELGTPLRPEDLGRLEELLGKKQEENQEDSSSSPSS